MKAIRDQYHHTVDNTEEHLWEMSARRVLEVQEEGKASQKWRVPLKEEVLDSISQGQKTMNMVFGQGSLFSPLLFGKFFDPSDAFPLWDFDSEVLLSGPGNSTGNSVTWFATDNDYVLRAKLPEFQKYDPQIHLDDQKVLEISGQWRRRESEGDWRTRNWWEFGSVRRLELPDNANWRKIEATINEDHLEIRIPKNTAEINASQEKVVDIKDTKCVSK